jgi:anti-sigma B factor antagonist
MAFGIDAVTAGDHVVLAVRGDVDLATAPLLRERIADVLAGAHSVVVDLGGVGFMDSTGLGVLAAAHHRAGALGVTLVLARPQRIVRNALRLVGVDLVVGVYDTVDAALAAG